MITRFAGETALLLIDVQVGVDDLAHWGGPNGRRNNPDAETRLAALLDAWRTRDLPLFWTLHNSREEHSPLRADVPGGASKPGFEPRPDEGVVRKDINGGFIGSNLEIMMRRAGVRRVVVGGSSPTSVSRRRSATAAISATTCILRRMLARPRTASASTAPITNRNWSTT